MNTDIIKKNEIKRRMRKLSNTVFILFIVTFLNGQQSDYFLGAKRYPFINYNNNTLLFPGNDYQFKKLYNKLDSIILYGSGKINIVHIGGSHIQADIYTHQIRKSLQSLQHSTNGGRGIVFPYSVAKTNNPSNYSVSYTGTWKYAKNTQYKRTSPLGLTGIAITTSDSIASISINPNADKQSNYYFNEVKLFHSPTAYEILLSGTDSVYKGIYHSEGGYSIFNTENESSIELSFEIPDSNSQPLSIYGLLLENDDPGIIYHAIGVNGAKLQSYINCELFGQHINVLNPDLVILSIGTNDGNVRNFNNDHYKDQCIKLIEKIKAAEPKASILLTVPNDSYLFKKYTNRNTELIRKEIFKIAEMYNYAVWDFYNIMGGLNSAEIWYNYALMKSDRIHFNREGYILKGNLFVTAFLSAWEKDLKHRPLPQQTYKTASTNTQTKH